MKKLSVSLILAGLAAYGCGCTERPPEPPTTTTKPAPYTSPSGQIGSAASGGMGKAASQQSGDGSPYFQVTRETFSAGEARAQGVVRNPGDYTYEKQPANYKVTEDLSSIELLQPTGEVSESSPGFKLAKREPLSTFSADVDTASYSNIRRELQLGQLPQPDQVRVEEMLNYFNYDLPEPRGDEPFSVTTEVTDCPWSVESRLMRVAIATKPLDRGDSPPMNLVFLLDVSGSMEAPDKLPLLKQSLRKLVDTLDDDDRVALVVYAGDSGIALPSTPAHQKTVILNAIDRLSAGGSTNGSAGIELAYRLAEENRSDGSVNRVILATDGDFNVGLSSHSELKSFIEEKRESGLFLSVLGFGRGGNDKLMETLADNGNGNYASIDNLNEARKVLVKEAGATLVTVAKDVKFQVDFDPKVVKSYRLIGYENRRLAARDFDDDTKDAGELGAGHSVTALYEIRLAETSFGRDLLGATGVAKASDLAQVKLRYKAPDARKSRLKVVPVKHVVRELDEASVDQQWATAVAGFGLLLKSEVDTETLPFSKLYPLMSSTMGSGPDSYEAEFYSLVKKAEPLLVDRAR